VTPVAVVHFADAWETIADAIPDEPALIHGSTIRTWREFDDRSARLAAALGEAGVGAGSTVAINMYNCSEFLETVAAAFKLRAVPATLNYRYLDHELHRLLELSEAVAVVFHASLAERVLGAAAHGLPRLRVLVQVDDGDGAPAEPPVSDYERLIVEHHPAPRIRHFADDHLLLFTGGTTGLPKGVLGEIGPMTRGLLGIRGWILGLAIAPDADPAEVAVELEGQGQLPTAVAASPLMHATALGYVSFTTLLAGGSVATLEGRRFDAHELLSVVGRRRVSSVGIVGDAFALPIVDALDQAAAAGRAYDTSSLRSICSAGVAWSAPVKGRLLEHIPQVLLSDGCGSTDAGLYGVQLIRKGDVLTTASFQPVPGLKVLDETKRELAPGQIGYLAAPLQTGRYFRDPEAADRTYFTIDGVEYAMPGDFGRLEDDGTVTLLGRGTSVINRGGEKIFPEEVEAVIKQLDGVADCLVFGTPDQRLGQQVTAVVQSDPGGAPTPEEIVAFTKQRLAAYKAPHQVILADVPRFPNGKPDFETARSIASTQLP
jgi:fatty-acyl-CoA synthase